MQTLNTEAAVGRAGRVRKRRRWRGGLVVIAALATLAAMFTIAPARAQQQPLSPCLGGPGVCIGDGVFVRMFTTAASTTGVCTWTITIDWGDGTSDVEVWKPPAGRQQLLVEHKYTKRGRYTVRDSAETSGPPGTICTAQPRVVEVHWPRGHVCAGRLATIVGTNKADRLMGTPGDDVIVGRKGNDIINGKGGDDRICGNEGNDKLTGADGSDLLHGDAGKDVLRGNAGVDGLWGGDGNDKLLGGGDLDALFGGPGRDLLNGGADNDFLWGDEGNDRLRGKAGNDSMNGGAGRDNCKGGGGTDTKTDCETG